METSQKFEPSPPSEVPSSFTENPEVLYLGKELGLELWIKPETSQRQSILIRSTSPEGVTRSSFMHVDGMIEQIPIFDNQDPLVLQPKSETSKRDLIWTPEKKSKSSNLKIIFKVVASILALVFLASILSGIVQMRVVLTGSMKPTINPGDLVIAVSKDYIEPTIGKVVLYSARDLQGKAVTIWCHRIISGDTKNGFIIKGDANAQPDIGTIPNSDIQTVMVLRIPYVGRLFNLYSLALIFSGLILLSFILRQRSKK
jgi:signal peptidase